MKLSQWFPQGGTLEDHKLRKSATAKKTADDVPSKQNNRKRYKGTNLQHKKGL